MSHKSTMHHQPSLSRASEPQTDDNDGQAEIFAPVICYCKVCCQDSLRWRVTDSLEQAGELPIKFRIPVEKGFFSLVDDFDFLNETDFLEVPFEVYDCMAVQFVSIPPSAFWHYPSPINPFYLIKDGRIQDHDCPNLSDYIDILSDATAVHFEDLPHIRASSPLPPSSPPPPSPIIEYVEKAIQTTGPIKPQKRKRSTPQSEGVGPAAKARRTTKFEVNLHIHCDKGSHSPKNGTGNNIDDPIVI